MSASSFCDVVIVGGGVCGVLAGQRFAAEGWRYKIVERAADYGGVWGYRANSYSHLQAYAGLYRWDQKDKRYALDRYPFKKCPGSTVLDTLRAFAEDHGLREHTYFGAEVAKIEKADEGYVTTITSTKASAPKQLKSSAVFVACGLLGEQHSVESRKLPNLERFTGKTMYAGKQADAKNYLDTYSASGKDVVILGSGAFGLEAMEAAHRAGAKSITVITRDRDRWILPYSQQFKFVLLSHCKLLPRRATCFLMEWWLDSLYKRCGIAHMSPPITTPQNFTGQCNDAFFQYSKEGIAKLMIDKVESFDGNSVLLESGSRIKADILVTALGHVVQTNPAFLKPLGVGFTQDLHNFAFLGKNPHLGCASDWVWFNVPHGPLKQIDSFVAARKKCLAGKEQFWHPWYPRRLGAAKGSL